MDKIKIVVPVSQDVIDFYNEQREKERERVRVNKQRGIRFEREFAQKFGARRIPFSGAGAVKGDLVWDTKYGRFLVECKFTAQNDRIYCLKQSVINKAAVEARIMNYAGYGIAIKFFNTPDVLFVVPFDTIKNDIRDFKVRPRKPKNIWVQYSDYIKPPYAVLYQDPNDTLSMCSVNLTICNPFSSGWGEKDGQGNE